MNSAVDIMEDINEKFTEEFVASVIQMVLIALVYLHAKNISHRDIRAGNILIDGNYNVKLADFWILAQLPDSESKRYKKIGSLYWISPEIIAKSGHDQSTDIWSFEITSIEMAEGNLPNSQFKPAKALVMIENDPPVGFSNPNSFSDEFRDFVGQCLSYLQEKRHSAQDLLSYRFILKNSKGSGFIKTFA